MIITRVKVKNFKSYDKCDLDLSGVSVCAIVGSNGSGKSTLAEAIIWGLFGYSKFPSAKDLIQSGEKKMSVEIEFTADGHHYKVQRAYDGSMEATIEMDGQSLTEYASGVTPAIVKALGTSRELIAESVIVQQGQLASFVNATSSERRDLIMAMLGMDKYQTAWGKAKETYKALVGTVESHDRTVSTLQANLKNVPTQAEIDSWLTSLTQQSTGLSDQIIRLAEQETQLKAKVEQAQQSIGECEIQVATLRREVNSKTQDYENKKSVVTRKIEVNQQAYNSRADIMLSVKTIEQELELIRNTETNTQALKLQISNCETQIAAQRAKLTVAANAEGTCPLCKTQLNAETWQKIIQDMQQVLTDLVKNMSDFQEAIKQMPWGRGLKAVAAEMEKQQKALGSADSAKYAIPELIAELNALSVEEDQTLRDLDQELKTATGKLTSLQGAIDADTILQLSQVASELKSVREKHGKNMLLMLEWAGHKKSREVLENSLSDAARLLEGAKKGLPEIEFVTAALSPSGIPLMLIDYYLPLIEYKAKELLYIMSDGALDVKLLVDGKKVDLLAGSGQLRPIKSLSGGEQTRVSLSLRLALSQVLFDIAGCKFDCLLIDEPEYLDDAGVSQFVNAISNLKNVFPQIFVISHLPTIKGAFPQYITIQKSGDVSTAALIA